ncbi:hypothetical protein ACXR0O_08815 [Verrucomicrobiota bacterium sgz303538]
MTLLADHLKINIFNIMLLRVRWLLLFLFVAFAAPLSLHAENYQYLDIQVPAGRVAHTFSLWRNGVQFAWLGMPTPSEEWLDGRIVHAGRFSLEIDVDSSEPFTIRDDTYNYFFDLGTEWVGYAGSVSPLVLSPLGWSTLAGNDQLQVFQVDANRAGHTFVLCQPDQAGNPSLWFNTSTSTELNRLNQQGVFAWPSGATSFEAYALYDPTKPFWLVDLSSQPPVRSSVNEIDLVSTPWTHEANLVPLVEIAINLYYANSDQVGRHFTLHSRFVGGVEQLQSLQAVADGNNISVKGVVAAGAEFWLTRDADQAVALNPRVLSFDGTTSTTYEAEYLPPLPPPPPPSATVQIRVLEPRPLHYSYSVNQYYAESEEWVSRLPVGSGPISVYNYDDGGALVESRNGQFLEFQIDPSRPYVLRDDTTGETFSENTVEVADGWVPWHRTPPDNTSLTINLLAQRRDHPLTLVWSNGQSVSVTPDNSGSPATKEFRDGNGNLLYTLDYLSFSIPNPLPYNNYSITVQDDIYQGETGIVGNGPVLDLSGWLPPASPKLLSISSSRWGHDLWLCQPNGDSFPIQQHATQGDFSFDPNQQGWFNSYYYFDATSTWHDFLGCWVEDRSASVAGGLPERSPVNPSNADLINWIALPAPENLFGELVDGLYMKLTWPLGGASPDGSFLVERRVGESNEWLVLGNVPIAGAYATPSFVDSAIVDGQVHHYRVRYTYGGRQSAPSPVFSESGWLDSDQDGLPNAWEDIWGTDPNHADNYTWRIGSGESPQDLLARARSLAQVGDFSALQQLFATHGNQAGWEQRPRLMLWQWHDIEDGSTHVYWSGNADSAAPTLVEREISEGQWVPVATTTAGQGYHHIIMDESSGQSTGPFPQGSNFRLNGDVTSNESICKIRIMKATATAGRSQPGFPQFNYDDMWDYENNCSKPLKYFRKASWEKSYSRESTLSDGTWTHEETVSGSHTINLATRGGHLSEFWNVADTDTSSTSHGTGSQDWNWETEFVFAGLAGGFDVRNSVESSISNSTRTWTGSGAHTETYQDTTSLTISTGASNVWTVDDDHSFVRNPSGGNQWTHKTYKGSGNPEGAITTKLTFPDNSVSTTTETVSYAPRDGGGGWKTMGSGNFVLEPTSETTAENVANEAWDVSVTLSNEYTVEEFMSDTRAIVPALGDASTPYWQAACSGFDAASAGRYYGQVNLDAGAGGAFPYGFQTSERYLSDDASYASLMRSEWWVEVNDCLPEQLSFIETEAVYKTGTRGSDSPPTPVKTLLVQAGSTPGRPSRSERVVSDVTGGGQNASRQVISDPIRVNVKNEGEDAGYRTGWTAVGGGGVLGTWMFRVNVFVPKQVIDMYGATFKVGIARDLKFVSTITYQDKSESVCSSSKSTLAKDGYLSDSPYPQYYTPTGVGSSVERRPGPNGGFTFTVKDNPAPDVKPEEFPYVSKVSDIAWARNFVTMEAGNSGPQLLYQVDWSYKIVAGFKKGTVGPQANILDATAYVFSPDPPVYKSKSGGASKDQPVPRGQVELMALSYIQDPKNWIPTGPAGSMARTYSRNPIPPEN